MLRTGAILYALSFVLLTSDGELFVYKDGTKESVIVVPSEGSENMWLRHKLGCYEPFKMQNPRLKQWCSRRHI